MYFGPITNRFVFTGLHLCNITLRNTKVEGSRMCCHPETTAGAKSEPKSNIHKKRRFCQGFVKSKYQTFLAFNPKVSIERETGKLVFNPVCLFFTWKSKMQCACSFEMRKQIVMSGPPHQ